MKNITKLVLIISVIIIVIALGGLGFFLTKKINKSEIKNSITTESTMTPAATPTQSQNKNETKKGPELPKDFPKDVPIYSNAAITTSSYYDKHHSYYVMMSSSDKYSAVKKFYADNITSNGWKIELKPIEIINDTGSAITYVAYKDDRQISMQIRMLGKEDSGNPVEISITVSDKISL